MTPNEQCVWYFAYGSNMCREKIRNTIGDRWREERIATAKGFEVVFNKISKNWDKAANIVDSPRKKVWGVLYEITESQFQKLTGSEKGYERRRIRVETKFGDKIVAETFVAMPDRTSRPGHPKREYLNFILEGGREHGLPRHYLRRFIGKAKGWKRKQ